MKKFSYKRYDVPQKDSPYVKNHKYRVFLGSGARHYFGSEFKAQRFLIKYSLDITNFAFYLNTMLVEYYSIYRTLWAFDCEKDKWKNKFESIEYNLNRVFSHTQSGYTAGMVWPCIANVCNDFYALKKEICFVNTQKCFYDKNLRLDHLNELLKAKLEHFAEKYNLGIDN